MKFVYVLYDELRKVDVMASEDESSVKDLWRTLTKKEQEDILQYQKLQLLLLGSDPIKNSEKIADLSNDINANEMDLQYGKDRLYFSPLVNGKRLSRYSKRMVKFE